MLQSFNNCSVCHKVAKRQDLKIYHFPNGPRLVCKDCYRNLPPDPHSRMPSPPGPKGRNPTDDIMPPRE